MENKQTAVEWLVDELLDGKLLMPSLIEQAIAMEKEQIKSAYNQADLDSYFNKTYEGYSEKYYNKTYGK